MKLALAALIATVSLAAAAQPQADRAPGFHERLYERYCEKLRESPEAYVHFVKRMMPIYGYEYTDFAPARKGDPVRADCKVSLERMAAVHKNLGSDPK